MLTSSVQIKPWRIINGLASSLLGKKAWYSDAAKIFQTNEIVPHIISVPPPKYAQVKYPSGATVNAGNILTPTEVQSIPEVSYEADSKAFHLLYFTDPDSPSRGRPTFREWHIWLVGNIPGSDVKSGEVLSEYISPCPPRETGKHRFVFLIFQQPSKLKFDERRLNNKRTSHRELFKIQAMVDKYKLGNPIAGNFFIAEWDKHVDSIYESLSRL